MAITKQTARKSTKGKCLSSSAVVDTADERKIQPLPAPKLKPRSLQGWPKVTLPAGAFTPDPVKEARAIKVFFIQQLDALKDTFLRELEQRDERQDEREMDLEELRTVVEEALEETVEELTTNITESVEEIIERQGEETTEEIVDTIEQLEARLVSKVKAALADNTKAMQEWLAVFLESKVGGLLAQESVTDLCEQLKAPGQQPTAATGKRENFLDYFFGVPSQTSVGTAQQPSAAKDTTRLDAFAAVTATGGQHEDCQLSRTPTQDTSSHSIEIAKLVQSIEELTRANSKLVDANAELAGANAALALANGKLVDANAALALTNDKACHSNDALALANEQLISSNKGLALRNSELEKANHDFVVENAKLILEVGALKRGQHDATKGFEERFKRIDERHAAGRKQLAEIYKDVEEIKGVLDRDRKHKLESLALFEQVFPEHRQGGSAATGKAAIGPPFQSTSRGAVAGEKEWEKLESSEGSEASGS